MSRVVSSIHVEPVFACCELDTHADTCAPGANFIPLSFTGRVCDVSPYNSNHYESEKDVPIISGGTAYTRQESGQTYILTINEGLWLRPKMHHSLLNPNQLRFHGASVHDNPFDAHNPPLSIEHHDVTIPLLITGTNIFLNTHTPAHTARTRHLSTNTSHKRSRVESTYRASCVYTVCGGRRFTTLGCILLMNWILVYLRSHLYIVHLKWRKTCETSA
jgi:hypothetical protein